MVEDLIITSIKAHYEFMKNRFHNKDTQIGFNHRMENILGMTNSDWFYKSSKHFSKGTGTAEDLCSEIRKNIRERFVKGRSGDFYMEKL